MKLGKLFMDHDADILDTRILVNVGLQNESDFYGIDPELDSLSDDALGDFMLCDNKYTSSCSPSMFGIGR